MSRHSVAGQMLNTALGPLKVLVGDEHRVTTPGEAGSDALSNPLCTTGNQCPHYGLGG